MNGGLIEFNPTSSITIPSGGFGAPLLLATGVGSRIVGDALDVSFANNGITAAAAQNGGDVELSKAR